MTSSARAMLHLVALLALLAIEPTRARLGAATPANIADLEKKIDEIQKQVSQKPSTSAKAGKFISSVTTSVDGAATQIKKCVDAGSSCNKGALAGSIVTLAGSVMAAASFLEPVGPIVGLLGGLLSSILGGGGKSGPPPLTPAEIKQAVFQQLQKFEMIKYAEMSFPAIQDGEMYPLLKTMSASASLNVTELGDSVVEQRLKGVKQFLPTLSQEITNVVKTMDQGYLLATSSRSTGSRATLLGTTPFKPFCAFNAVLPSLMGYTTWNKYVWTPMRAQASAWDEFQAMLLGYKALAAQLASAEVLLQGIEMVANATTTGPTWLEDTHFVRSQIHNTLSTVSARTKTLVELQYGEDCYKPFNMTMPAECKQVFNKHHKPSSAQRRDFVKVCAPLGCVSSQCRSLLSSPLWE